MILSLFRFRCVFLASVTAVITLHGGQKLRYHFEKGDSLRYSSSIDSKTSGQERGEDFVIIADADFDYTIRPGERTAGGNYALTVTIDRFHLRLDAPVLGFVDSTVILNEYAGKRLNVELTELGKTVSIEPIDLFPRWRFLTFAEMNPFELFQRLIFELPEQAVDTGSTWTNTSPDSTVQDGMAIRSNQNIGYRVTGVALKGRYRCWQITIAGRNSMEGTGKQSGMTLTTDAVNKLNGVVYFAPKEGVCVSAEQTIANDMTVTATGKQTGAQTTSSIIRVTTALIP